MKKIISFFVLLSCSLLVSAQPIDTFYREGTWWVNMYNWTYNSPTPPYGAKHYIEGFKLQVGADTTVGAVVYKKVYYTLIGRFETTSTPPYTVAGAITKWTGGPQYIGRIRIDGRKVYFTEEGESIGMSYGLERIMIDYTGNVGDSVDCYFYPNRKKVTAVDTMHLNTGSVVNRYYYNGSVYGGAIEGLGATDGTLADLRTVTGFKPNIHSISTLCYSSGDVFYKFPMSPGVYDAALINSCFDLDVVGVEQVKRMPELAVYPNPCRGSFTVAGMLQGQEVNFTIFNTLGQSVYRQDGVMVNNSIRQDIAVHNLPSGVYRLLVTADGSTKVFPIMVE